MRSGIFNLDWEKFNWRDPVQRKKLAGALQCFCALPNRFIPPQFAKVQEFIKAHKEIREFTLGSDGWTNEKAIAIIEKFNMASDFDMGYERIFDIRDYSGSGASGFDLAAVRSGLTFSEIIPGEKVKMYSVKGAKARVNFCWYGAGLGWHRGLFDDHDWWTIEDNAKTFRNEAYASRANVYYNLLETVMDAKGCCAEIEADCEDCSKDARSLAASINYAAVRILEDVKGRGYGINPENVTFIVLSPLRLRGRVRAALGIRQQAFSDSEKLIDYNFQPISSMMLENHDRIAVILPGRTLKIGYRMDLTLFDDFDILSYTDEVAGWMRHGGVVGDTDQIQCISVSAESGSCPASGFNPLTTCGEITQSVIDKLQI